MTIGTTPLTPDATWQEVHHLVTFLAVLGIEQVAVTYGWGCNATGIEQPVAIPLDELVKFLHKSIAQDIYHLGEDNLTIEASVVESNTLAPSALLLKITLCHDADIHFEATAGAGGTALEARLRAEWQARGIRVWAGRTPLR